MATSMQLIPLQKDFWLRQILNCIRTDRPCVYCVVHADLLMSISTYPVFIKGLVAGLTRHHGQTIVAGLSADTANGRVLMGLLFHGLQLMTATIVRPLCRQKRLS